MPKDTSAPADATNDPTAAEQTPTPETVTEPAPADTGGEAEQAPETANDTGDDDKQIADPTYVGTAGTNAPFTGLDRYVPTPEDRRQRALELATYGGAHGLTHEPIKSVLARAEAYRLYVESGETGIVN